MPLPTWNACFPRWSHGVGLPARWSDVLEASPRDEAELAFAQRVEETPKVELHVHAEAAVSDGFYAALNATHRLFEPANMPALRAPFGTLREFIGAWMDNTKLLREASAVEDLVVEFARGRAAQNILYTEAHVSPSDFSYVRERFPMGIAPFPLDVLLASYAHGALKAAHLFPAVTIRFIVDALWIATDAEYERVLEALASIVDAPEAQDPRGGRFFVAVGLGGPETTARAGAIVSFLDGARRLGLGVDIHSGENVTAAEHRRSVETLAPDRVGHGIGGASEGFLFDGHITTCPLSNLLTGSHEGPLRNHAVALMVERAHPFSLGSDDPLLFRTTLTLDYVALRRVFGWEDDFVALTCENGLKAAFDGKAARRALATRP